MKPVSETKKVGIWVRVSTEDQAQGESPENHEMRARYFAESKGWEVAEVYRLEGVSGKSVIAQAEAQKMLQAVRQGKITGLIFSKLARLARNTRELLDFAEIFETHGAHLISLQESIDTSSPAGRLFYTLIAAMAQWEREEISERVAASVPIRAKLGKPLGGAGPYGYMWKDRQLVPNPGEAKTCLLIFELFAEHRRKKVVARLLNEMGLKTRRGCRFTDTGIDRILREPTVKGHRRANYTTRTPDSSGWVIKPESEWVWSQVEAIVPEELWNQCNRFLNDMHRPRVAKQPTHLLAGFVFCTCGNKMYVPSNTPKYVCQKCRNKISIEDLESIFQDQLKSFCFSPTDVQYHLRQGQEIVRQKTDQMELMQREESRIRQEMNLVYRLYVDQGLSTSGFSERYKPLENELANITEQLPRLQAEVDSLKIALLSNDQIFEDSRDLFSRWPSLNTTERRQIAENIVEKITVGEIDINIELCQLPSFSNMTNSQQSQTDLSSRCPAT